MLAVSDVYSLERLRREFQKTFSGSNQSRPLIMPLPVDVPRRVCAYCGSDIWESRCGSCGAAVTAKR
jgi:hypothetical protein